MAPNSRRERIIVYVVDQLETLASINTVVRRMPSLSELEDFALPQLPVAAVIGRMPTPATAGIATHISRRTSVDIIVSELVIDVLVYAQDLGTPDTTVSDLADDLWALLYADQRMGGLVVETRLELEEETLYWHPYVAFRLSVRVKYKHDTGGI